MNLRNKGALMGLMLGLAACARLDHLGKPPTMSEPQSSPEFDAMISPVLNMAPGPQRPDFQASFWAGSTNSLVRDSRASQRGDILTVVIQIDDKAEISNSSSRSRDASDDVSIPSLMGIP